MASGKQGETAMKRLPANAVSSSPALTAVSGRGRHSRARLRQERRCHDRHDVRAVRVLYSCAELTISKAVDSMKAIVQGYRDLNEAIIGCGHEIIGVDSESEAAAE